METAIIWHSILVAYNAGIGSRSEMDPMEKDTKSFPHHIVRGESTENGPNEEGSENPVEKSGENGKD